MAVVSDTMYAAVSFVSSSAYYGYVPPCRKENHESNTARTGLTEIPMFAHRCYPDTAMETDDDGRDYPMASRCLSNDCVILETRDRLDTENKQQRQQDADTMQRRNRKRCNSDFGPAREQKKFREGGGHSRVYCGTGSTKDYGLATVCESESLHLNTANNRDLEQSMNMKKSCCWAAGNPNSISNLHCKGFSSSNDSKLVESSTEYEKILFGTHGCSVHHLHRLQLLDNDCIETEF